MQCVGAVFLVLCCTGRILGQQSSRFRSFGVDDGLPQSSVWSILQDRQGFLWIGTADGLCRFDGYEFRPVQPESGSIKGQIDLFEDGDGAIWISDQRGISRYDPVTGKLTLIRAIPNPIAGEALHRFVAEDSTGRIWFGVSRQGLASINRHTGAYSAPRRLAPDEAGADEIRDGYLDAKGRLWLVNLKSGLMCFDVWKEATLPFHVSASGPMCLLPLNDSVLLFPTGNGVVYFNTVSRSSRVVKPFGLDDMSAPSSILDMVFDMKRHVWLCTDHGVYVFDPIGGKVLRQYINFGMDAAQRSYNYTSTGLCDRSGNMWLGTNGDGLKLLPNNTKQFLHYVQESAGGSVVKSICLLDSIIYAGQFDNGLDLFHVRTGFIRKLSRTQLPGVPANSTIYAIEPFDSTQLFIYSAGPGSYDIGLLDTRSLEYRSLRELLPKQVPDLEIPKANYPFALALRKGSILLNYSDRLLTLTREGQRFLVHSVAQFNGVPLTCVFRTSSGALIAGSLNGFFRQVPGGWVHERMRSETYVKTFTEDSHRNLWVGTTSGLYVYNDRGTELAFFNTATGLRNDFIYGLLRDRRGRIWGSHNKGLSVFDPATGTVRHWSKEDGLQSNEFNTGAYDLSADGTLLFGGINGVNAFNPDLVVPNPARPVTRITGITLFDKPLHTDTAYSFVRNITLPYDQNSLGFEFAGLEYTASDRNQYAYMLEGVDPDWIYAGTERSTRYPALQPGRYLFRVKSANADGVWETHSQAVAINILPPFWQRPWFMVLILATGIATVAGVVSTYQRAVYRRRLRAIEMERRIQVERERISRDLHDNVGTQLSLIRNNIDWIARPGEDGLDAAQRDKLGSISGAAQEVITTLRHTIWALNKEQITLEELSDKLKAFITRQLGTDPAVTLSFTEELTEPLVLGPSEALHLFRICQEAITNALKYAAAKQLSIAIASTGLGYDIVIADDGLGFSVERTDPESGYGLENMRFRAKEIGCELSIFSTPGKGTKVHISRNMVHMQ
jgi:signal transduction histidine kinase/ligand-binding sensor domain-containing protein